MSHLLNILEIIYIFRRSAPSFKQDPSHKHIVTSKTFSRNRLKRIFISFVLQLFEKLNINVLFVQKFEIQKVITYMETKICFLQQFIYQHNLFQLHSIKISVSSVSICFSSLQLLYLSSSLIFLVLDPVIFTHLFRRFVFFEALLNTRMLFQKYIPDHSKKPNMQATSLVVITILFI